MIPTGLGSRVHLTSTTHVAQGPSGDAGIGSGGRHPPQKRRCCRGAQYHHHRHLCGREKTVPFNPKPSTRSPKLPKPYILTKPSVGKVLSLTRPTPTPSHTPTTTQNTHTHIHTYTHTHRERQRQRQRQTLTGHGLLFRPAACLR